MQLSKQTLVKKGSCWLSHTLFVLGKGGDEEV